VASCDWSAPSALAVTQLPPVLIVDSITRVGAEQPERLSSMPRLWDGEGARKCRASAACIELSHRPIRLVKACPLHFIERQVRSVSSIPSLMRF
jgi:hypothetical protein